MSLRLCRSEKVKNPYYVSFLGVHLYSSQELAYVIYHYPLLVMDHLVDDRLLDFLREELNLGFLALKLENCMAPRNSYGGPAPEQTTLQIQRIREFLAQRS